MNYYSKIGIELGGITESLNDKTDRDMRNVDTTSGADSVIAYQFPSAANNYTWYRKYKSGWVEQGIHGNTLYAATSSMSLAGNTGMEIQSGFSLPIPIRQLASGNAEASGKSCVLTGDVYNIGNNEVRCWIYNCASNPIDPSTILIHITISGIAA